MGAIRSVLAVVLGYAIYVMGLMPLVIHWFVRGTGLQGAVSHVANIAALMALGWIVGWVTKWVAGGRTGALSGLAVVIIAIGILNISLGVAAEPPWYTVMVVVITVSMLLLHRTGPPRTASTE